MNIKEKCNNAIVNLKDSLNELKNEATGDYEEMLSDIKKSIFYEHISEEKLNELQLEIKKISNDVFKSYLPVISEKYTPESCSEGFSHMNQLRWLKINKWVSDKSEKDIDKLKNIYNSLTTAACRVALIYKRSKDSCDVFIGIASSGVASDPAIVQEYSERFCQSVNGNFPGSAIVDITETLMEGLNCENITDSFDYSSLGISKKNSVSIVTNVASEKSESFASQGIEKLIDGFVPKNVDEEYTLLLLSEPLTTDKIENERKLIFDYYTALSPYVTWQSNFSSSDAIGKMRSASASTNVGFGIPYVANISLNLNVTDGTNVVRTSQNGFVLTHTLFEIKVLLARLEEQMKRLEQCEALGLWQFAAYIISDDYSMANNVANMYKSLTQGEKSYIDKTAINIWGNSNNKNDKLIENLVNSLQRLEHPKFCLISPDDNEDMPETSFATSFISGIEIAQALNLPKKSVAGLPVLECAEFGREVMNLNDDKFEQLEITRKTREGVISWKSIELGKIYHMRKKEKTPVMINKNQLTSHVFITGSTGSGKSNTIYNLIDRLCLSGDSDTNFLVIEPAKGEYKDYFGGSENVHVYGTNFKKTPLLRLNPFSFPSDIHVLEHIDRLIEIFNACWPMYAAMPAVLKAAIEKAYVAVGWSLLDSDNSNLRFPTFRDVMIALPEVVDSKGFSKDTQGDYKGALLTRLESLTNGINGQVFCSTTEVLAEELFDRNVIIDLSRVGSMETKALLMGIIVLKLQEHRMSQRSNGDIKPNNKLRHITVLEEAHNLLRRISTEQTQENSNLQGKSVEMIANAIAELRSFGEGFIIADQSPGLLDMAVIRNTNTKIIMRLPDASDRDLVGKAAGLNDNQIIELSKLETGVAAIYQNEWLEPVLCKIDKFEKVFASKPMFENVENQNAYNFNTIEPQIQDIFLKEVINHLDEHKEFTLEEIDKIRRWIDSLNTGAEAKRILYSGTKRKLNEDELGYSLYCAVKGKSILEQIKEEADEDRIPSRIESSIRNALLVDRELAESIRRIICYYAADQVGEDKSYYENLRCYGSRLI